MNQSDPALEGDAPRRSSVNVPTVLASAGVAAVVSAVVVTIGVVGIAVGGGFDDSAPNAAAQTPTVVNLGAAQSALPQAAAAAAPASAAPASTPATAAAPAAEQVPASDGGAGSGAAPVAPAPQPGATAAPAPTAVAPAAAPTAVAPQALSPGQLNTKVRLLMNTGASRAARADELESGARGLGPVDAVANVLRVSGAGFTYQMIAPVTVSGNSMTATLQMSLVGQGSRTRALTWVWTGDKWKLSDRSTCDVAGLALVPCSL